MLKRAESWQPKFSFSIVNYLIYLHLNLNSFGTYISLRITQTCGHSSDHSLTRNDTVLYGL